MVDVTKLKYFNDVKEVLGTDYAKVSLEEVWNNLSNPKDKDCFLTADVLVEAFNWSNAVQGPEFWRSVRKGIEDYHSMEELPYFPYVSMSLGEKTAKRQLFLVFTTLEESEKDAFTTDPKINRAFNWANTPQGHKYWEGVVANISEIKRHMREVDIEHSHSITRVPLKMQDMHYLAYYGTVSASLGPHLAAYELYEVYKTLSETKKNHFVDAPTLGYAFNWGDSPQGRQYWEKVSKGNKRVEINGIDFGF